MGDFRIDNVGGGYVAAKPNAVPLVSVGAGRGITLTPDDKHILHTGADEGFYTLYVATGSGNVHTLSRDPAAGRARLIAVQQDKISGRKEVFLSKGSSLTVQDVATYKWVIK